MKLIDVQKEFATEDQCYEYLEAMRWPNGVRCPVCGNDKISKFVSSSKKQQTRRVYQCLEPTCKQQFTATAGTIFHDTHLPLNKWFMAIALIVDAKKGMSAAQLQRHLGVAYRTAWYLAHRIREAMQDPNAPKLVGTVEIDETYIGGKQRGHKHQLKKKDCVLGIRERGGQLRLMHVPNARQDTVYDHIAANVDKNVKRIVTDESRIYNFKLTQYHRVPHDKVNHIKGEYVRGDVYTNTIESAFSLLKRGVIGTYHQLSIKHLQRYLNEFGYRFNRREIATIFEDTVRNLTSGKNIQYKQLTAKA
ncbi:MAG TPA: IS1595 family transposase [Terriglobales bacterium]|nr:IS1595 family transposase [Terriglobales bacterium]